LLDFDHKKQMKTGLGYNKYKIKVNNNTLIDILILEGKKGKTYRYISGSFIDSDPSIHHHVSN